MELNVLYFALLRERVGRTREVVTCPDGATVAAVVEHLCEMHPDLRPLVVTTRVAVDGEFVRGDDLVPDGAEFVLIPPVAGGAGPATITEQPLGPADIEELTAAVSDDTCGGVVTFCGVVRNHADGRPVDRLYYESYRPMAERQLVAIVADVEARVPGSRVAVRHRVGMLEVGDTAVVIAAASAHRAEAFDACRLVIERIKQDVPIWKREIGPDGEQWV